MSPVGKINTTQVEVITVEQRIEWRIDDFLLLPQEVDTSYFSPEFSLAGATWQLWIFPNGETNVTLSDGSVINSEGLGLYLRRASSGTPIHLDFLLGLKTSEGKIYPEELFKNTYDRIGGCGRYHTISRGTLLEKSSEYISSGALTLTCRIKHPDSAKISTQLPRQLNPGASSRTTVGEITTAQEELITVESRVEWLIDEFLSLPQEVDMFCSSHEFPFAGATWKLQISPNGRTNATLVDGTVISLKGLIVLYLVRTSSGTPISLEFYLGLQTSDGKIEPEEAVKYTFEKIDDRRGHDIIKRVKLLEESSKYFPTGTLTATCRILHPESVKISNVKKFSFSDIRRATNNFSHVLGEGNFGQVYKGEIGDRGATVHIAAKVLKEKDKQFTTELKTLASFKHEFLVPVIGYCDEAAHPCIVLEYIANGTLEGRLACKDDVDPLPWDVRLIIAYCSGLGINHLNSKGHVHRDIKSANILLDKHLFPKVADFGLVRIGESGPSVVKKVTQIAFGTHSYMAPEAFCYDVSVKLDTFSFGVVLLELLTGLPAYHEDLPLYEYMDLIPRMLDSKAHWDAAAAEKVRDISERCLKKHKKDRPFISEILDDLKALLPASAQMSLMKITSSP